MKIYSFIAINFVLLIFVLLCLLRSFAGTFILYDKEKPGRVDVIFVFAGENVRAIYGTKLRKEFPDSKLIISHTKEKRIKNFIKKKYDWDMNNVTIIDTCESTFSELKFLKHKLSNIDLPKKDTINVALVSGPYHMRRIMFTAHRKVDFDDNIKLYSYPVPLKKYGHTINDYKKWWKIHGLEWIVKSEIKKLIYYVVAH